MFTNPQVELETLPRVDQVNLRPISKKFLIIILINKFIAFGVVYIALFLVNTFNINPVLTEFFWHLIIIITSIFAFNIFFSVLAFEKRKYALRQKDLIYSKGLLYHKLIVIPISRIQHTEETKTWLARQFNLASLKIFTAGDSGTDLSLRGLTEVEAKRINDFINSKVDANN